MEKNKADLLNKIKNKVGKLDIADDSGFVNPESGTSVVSKSDGNSSMAAGEYAQFKLDKKTGNAISHSKQHTETAVIKDLNVVDLNLNRHKFNNQLVELTDFRDFNGNVVGGMVMNGTVLVKTWEHSLQKWVLIRRPISTPIFSNRLNVATTPEQMELELKIMEDIRKYYIEKEK